MASQNRTPGSKLNPVGLDFTPTIRHDTYEYIKPEKLDIKGRAVLITGASKGIGRETALSFAKAGASYIALGARSSLDSLEKEIQTAAEKAGRDSPKVITLQLDVADYASTEAAAKEVENAFGRLDIVINNAGYLEPFVKILEVDPEEWRRSYEVNIFGTFHVTKAFLPLLLKTSNGLKEILNLSSVGAHAVGTGGSAYRPAKLAVIRFGEFINAEEPEVLSYSFHPGGVPTELSAVMGEHMKHVLIDTPQIGADTIVFLTSERREWLAGRYVSATWDMEELLSMREKIEKEDLLKVRLALGTA